MQLKIDDEFDWIIAAKRDEESKNLSSQAKKFKLKVQTEKFKSIESESE